MKVSIIIETCNHFFDFLEPCLDTIEKYTDLSDKEIIIISNGSKDETISRIEQRKSSGINYRLVDFPEPINLSKAINIVSLMSKGEYLIFLRNDIQMRERSKKELWVDSLMKPFQDDPSVGMTGFFKGRDTNSKEEAILFLSCMIKRSIFLSVGGANESWTNINDVDLCNRIRKNGYKTVQVPKDFPIHEKSSIAEAYAPFSFGSGSRLEISGEYVIKKYKEFDLDNEINCLKLFSMDGSNPYSPKIELVDRTFKIKRYKFSLGTIGDINQKKVKRMFFTISPQDFLGQIEDIEKILKKLNINHRDINPANLLFSEEERCLKLIDFYWSRVNNIIVNDLPKLNSSWSTDDSIAIQKIKNTVLQVFSELKNPINELKTILLEMGKIYRDGSSPAPGVPYHRIDIPYFSSGPICKDITKEFSDILKNITCTPKKALDIGCALGYTSFNLIRKFFLEEMISFEADPYAFMFLQECKRIFNLEELKLNRYIDDKTIIPKIDIVICTNVHQWLYSQLGREKTGILMTNLISNCKEMFFQSSGLESGGKQVEEFRNEKDIQNYLYSYGAKDVTYISPSFAHGGIRHLFRVRGVLQ